MPLYKKNSLYKLVFVLLVIFFRLHVVSLKIELKSVVAVIIHLSFSLNEIKSIYSQNGIDDKWPFKYF